MPPDSGHDFLGFGKGFGPVFIDCGQICFSASPYFGFDAVSVVFCFADVAIFGGAVYENINA